MVDRLRIGAAFMFEALLMVAMNWGFPTTLMTGRAADLGAAVLLRGSTDM